VTSFADNLHQAFMHSQYDLSMENRKTDLYYQKLERQHNQTFNEIRNKLGKHRKLMLKLERLQNEIDSIDEDFIYLQGFIDCVTLLRTIKLL
jgi:hypothetical protein